MNPTRRRRLWFVLAVIAAAALVAVLVGAALQRNVAYLFTPAEVLDGRAGADVASGETRFRLGGMVAKGSFERTPGSMEARFQVSDGDALMPVVYSGILPDLFRESQSVVATGRMRADGTFVADCLILDRSAQGARIRVLGSESVPEAFRLIDEAGRESFFSRTVWERGDEAGLSLAEGSGPMGTRDFLAAAGPYYAVR